MRERVIHSLEKGLVQGDFIQLNQSFESYLNRNDLKACGGNDKKLWTFYSTKPQYTAYSFKNLPIMSIILSNMSAACCVEEST